MGIELNRNWLDYPIAPRTILSGSAGCGGPGVVHNLMTPLERAIDLSYPAFAILHQHGRFSGPPHQRVCEAILGDLRIARRRGVGGVVLEIFSRDQQVMGLLLPDDGPAQLLGFDDRTMMYEGDAKDWEAKVHWHGDQLRHRGS